MSKMMNGLDVNKLLSKFRAGSVLPPSDKVFFLPLSNERCADGDEVSSLCTGYQQPGSKVLGQLPQLFSVRLASSFAFLLLFYFFDLIF